MMDHPGHKCHCLAPATWFVRIVKVNPAGEHSIYAEDTWATCDDHLAEASRKLITRYEARNDHGPYVVMLRSEQ